jgi:hypothetical protein
MEKTTLYLPADLRRGLKDAARRSGRPQAVLIREAIGEYLSSRSSPRPRSIGLGDDFGVSAAESEDWLRQHWTTE